MIDQTIMERLSVLTEEERAILDGRGIIDRSLYMDGSRDVITGDKLLDRDKLITIRPHTRFVAFPEHTHDYVEMVYMCQGETTHRVNGKEITLHEGELLMLGQNARQAIEKAEERDIAVNFIVRPAFFSGTLSFLGDEETPLRRFVLDCLCGGGGYLYFQVADVLPIQNLIENLLYTMISDTPNKRAILQMTMGLLFAQLMNHTESLRLDSGDDAILIRVLRHIEDRYRDASLSQLAEELPYELTALSRLIKQKTGKTFTELLQEKRLSQAAWLLRNTNQKVVEIGHSVGYENLSYFHRLFAVRFGTTAKKFRDSK